MPTLEEEQLKEEPKEEIKEGEAKAEEVATVEAVEGETPLEFKDIKGGFDVFSSAPTHEAVEGKLLLYKDTTNGIYRLYARVNKSWRLLGSTQFLTSLNLDGLSDVVITSVAQGDILYYNGANWVNLGPGTSGYFLKTQGAGANPAWAAVGGDITTTAEAGEAITAGNAVSLVAKPTSDVLYEPTSGLNFNFGDAAGNEYAGQGFTPGATGYICKVGLKLKKVGTPSDTITIAIYSGTTAPATLIDSVTLAGSSLTTSYAWYYVLFNYKQQLTASSQYFIVVNRSGANDASNYYQWAGIVTGTYSGTNNTAYRGSTATTMAKTGTDPYNDLTFEVYKESTTAVVIRKSVASSQLMTLNWAGFCESAVSDGATGTITRLGTVSGLSSLTPGRVYYLSDTAGAISTSQGTYKATVLVATSTTAGEIVVVQPDKTENSRFGGSNTNLTINQTLSAGQEVTFTTITIPANTLGSNGILKLYIRGWVDATGAGGRIAIYLNTTSANNMGIPTAGDFIHMDMMVINRNATNSQITTLLGHRGITSLTSILDTDNTFAIDTTADMNLVIKLQDTGVGANYNVTLSLVLVEIYK